MLKQHRRLIKMKMPNSMKKITSAVALAAAIAMPAAAGAQTKEEKKQVSGLVEYVVSEHESKSLGRLNLFYDLPGDFKAYTFGEFYKDGRGYFGKHNFTRKVAGPLTFRTEVMYVNEPFTRIGAGVQLNLPLPNKGNALVKYLPGYLTKDGLEKDRSLAGAAFSLPLGKGVSLSAFGEGNASGGFKWGYGEVELSKTIKGKYEVSYNPILRGVGKAKPSFEHAISFGYKF